MIGPLVALLVLKMKKFKIIQIWGDSNLFQQKFIKQAIKWVCLISRVFKLREISIRDHFKNKYQEPFTPTIWKLTKIHLPFHSKK